MIKSCTCKHKYQDKKHGKGKRVFNKTGDKNPDTYRCSVCGKVK